MFDIERIIRETKEHRDDVKFLLNYTQNELEKRICKHDHTKLIPENAKILADCLNGTRDWNDWSEVHFKSEDHHPEYFDKLEDMNLFCLLETVADGCAANYRRSNDKPTWQNQYDFYVNKKGFDKTTASILANTFMIMHEKINKKSRY